MKKIIISLILIVVSIVSIACNNQSQNNNVNSNNNKNEPSNNTFTDNLSKISLDKAKEIALKHTNLTQSQVTFIKSELEFDDGIEVYDIEFYFENKEYEYDINAVTGDIIKYDYDNYNISDSNNTSPDNLNKISLDKAKEIALKHTNLTQSQVTFIKSELEFDDGIEVYDIEFNINNTEYNYKINSNNGDIVSYEKDLD